MLNILIVDDDESLCECLLQLMPWGDMQCNVPTVVHGGLNAWELLQQNKFDFIISDIKMPMMDGTELARLIHEKNIPTKIVFLSAYEDFSAAKKALKYGVVDYILKPIDYECLSSLEEIIRSLSETELPSQQEVLEETDYMARQIKTLVDENCFNPDCNVTWIADKVHICSAYVGRIFNKVQGVKLTEYITNRRMEEACKLLRGEDITVNVISRQVGYRDVNYFTRAFRARIGMSPSEYRRKNKN